MRGHALAAAAALTLLPGIAGATLVAERDEPWTKGEEQTCLAENHDPSPQVVAERESIAKRAPVLHVDAAIGGYGGYGSPGGLGGYFRSGAGQTPIGTGYAAFVRTDLMAVAPLWVSAQTHAFFSPRLEDAVLMSDVFVGYDFHGYGNFWSAMRKKHSVEYAYGCGFGRHDIALVGGLKSVVDYGDPGLTNYRALATGVQMRFVTDLKGYTIGLDFDVIGLYDPGTHHAGAQVQDVLHVGSLAITESIGFVWARGGWAMLAIGSSFEL